MRPDPSDLREKIAQSVERESRLAPYQRAHIMLERERRRIFRLMLADLKANP